MRTRCPNVPRVQRLSTLMPLVSVLDTHLTRADFRPTTIISAALGTLFRGFWYAHTLFGFLSPRAPLSEWQRSALLSVARRAPSLVVGLSRDVVEAEAQLNALLKHIGNSVSVEVVRNDLSTGIASQSTRFSSLSPAHVVFLGAMWRLETLRAQAGAFSPLFSYYDVPAFTQEAAGAEIIQSVGDTVRRDGFYQSRLPLALNIHFPIGPRNLHLRHQRPSPFSPNRGGHLSGNPGHAPADGRRTRGGPRRRSPLSRQSLDQLPVPRLRSRRRDRHARALDGTPTRMPRRIHRRGQSLAKASRSLSELC